MQRSNGVLLVMLAARSFACDDSRSNADQLSREPIPIDPSWQDHVLDVPGGFVWPESVAIEGDATAVNNPEGLLAEGGGETTLTVSGAAPVRLIVELPAVVSGHVEVGVRNAQGGPLRLSYAEYRDYLGREGDASTDPNDFFYLGRTLGKDDDPDGRADVFEVSGTTGIVTSPGLRGSQRYIAIALDGPGSVTLDFVRVRQTNLSTPHDGHFLASDDALVRAWYASAYGVALSTVRDTRRNPDGRWVIVDGPKRDRVAYAGDLRIVAQAAYYQSSAYRDVVRDTLDLFACQQRADGSFPAASVVDPPCRLGDPGPPDGSPPGFEPPGEAALARIDSFTAWWVVGLGEYLLYTGDTGFVTPLLPVARRAVQFFLDRCPDGVLWKTDDYDGAPAFNWHPPDKAVGVDGFSNVAFYAALRALAVLERDVAGDTAAAARLDARADRVRTGLIAALWDPGAGAMRLNSDDPRRDHAADVNAGVLERELLDPAQAISAMAFLEHQLGTPFGTATSELPDNPYMTRYISPFLLAHEALGRFRYGDGAGALRVIRTAWTHMLDHGPGTAWEEIGLDGKPANPRPGTSLDDTGFVDLVHAWSTAVPALSEHVLGVRPVANGYQQWAVTPEPVDLQWAQGDVPTPAGPLSVRWRRGNDDASFVITIEAPAATTGRVAVPLLGESRTIAMDGMIVWRDGRPVAGVQARQDGDRVVFEGLTGSHTLAWVR